VNAVAVIDELRCIGCVKCIAACPFDAIVGADRLMHTVIAAECVGCELCVAPCPVDCIEMISVPARAPDERLRLARQAKVRYRSRRDRLLRDAREREAERARRKAALRAP
jgi:electron transport complex protein RnfB